MQYYITQITKAQEDERLRISRELHDDTAQLLADISRGLTSLTSYKKTLKKTDMGQLEKLGEMANAALKGVRRFSQDLRPSILDDLGLVPALEGLLTDLEQWSEIKAKLDISGKERRLKSEKELTIFRIAQEALSNIRRHSHASSVNTKVDFGDDAITVIISDNGKGFDMPERTSDLALHGKLGIIGMRERARLVGGTLVLQSEEGKGTIITLRVPVSEVNDSG
jgi:signal transduction histidine kinase